MTHPVIEIDRQSGFCFGVINAIKHAERELDKGEELYSLGDIVHNNEEVERLQNRGMQTIDYTQLQSLNGKRVLFRAHGEPPKVYEMARERGIELVDATCPVVVRLQKQIHKKYQEIRPIGGQIVIYGKKGHAEVNGLVGQTDGEAIVIQHKEDVDQIDFTRPIALFSQTTQSLSGYHELIELLRSKISNETELFVQDTICRQVSNRIPHIEQFASQHELVLFVAGSKSSNGKVLYEHCRKGNERSVFISSADEITPQMLEPTPKTIGICGATSTPMWQMEEVARRLRKLFNMPDAEVVD